MSDYGLIFKYLDAINSSKINFLQRPETIECQKFKQNYSPFVIGTYLGGSIDTLMLANIANTMPGIKDNKERHFCFLLGSIRPRKRFVKWPKAEKSIEIEAISEYYGVSIRIAKDYAKVLDKASLDKIIEDKKIIDKYKKSRR